jgi:hypothetical protein
MHRIQELLDVDVCILQSPFEGTAVQLVVKRKDGSSPVGMLHLDVAAATM